MKFGKFEIIAKLKYLNGYGSLLGFKSFQVKSYTSRKM